MPYSNNDNLVGFWLVDELSSERHLLAAMRGSLACSCGCKGWCSYSQIFEVLTWSLRACEAGRWPAARPDGEPWRPNDSHREARAGEALDFRTCMLYIKGDWAEYAHTFGFPGWGSNLRPCWQCNCSPFSMYSIESIGPRSSPWRFNLPTDYSDACSAAEVVVTIGNSEDLDRLCTNLEFDIRRSGGQGICVKRD